MTIEIAGVPTPAKSPSFAGLTIRVPLSEKPTRAWLDLLTLQALPGKGYRVDGAALEFHLDRDAHDVLAAMRKLADAIAKAAELYTQDGERLEAGAARSTERTTNIERKIAGQLEEWSRAQAPPAAPLTLPETTLSA